VSQTSTIDVKIVGFFLKGWAVQHAHYLSVYQALGSKKVRTNIDICFALAPVQSDIGITISDSIRCRVVPIYSSNQRESVGI
jgi:hypothetical protein